MLMSSPSATFPLPQYNADPIYVANDGCSALLCAVNGGYVDCVRTLLKHKNCHINPKSEDKVPSSLYAASQNGDDRLVGVCPRAQSIQCRQELV